MKKIILFVLTLTVALSAFSAVYAKDEITVRLNGETLSFADQEPVILNDRTMVPFRAIAEALGCIVEWYPEMQEVYVAFGMNQKVKIVVFAVEQQQIRLIDYFNGEKGMEQEINSIRGDVPPTIINDRTMIPLRSLADSMGADVSWDGASKTVDINLDNSGFVSVTDDDCINYLAERYYKVNYIFTKDEDKANTAAEKAASGSNFDELINEYTEDENYTYVYTEGEMIPAFSDTVKNLSLCEVTQTPIKTDDGYFIVKRLGFDKSADESVIDDIRLSVLFVNSGLDVE